MKQIYRKIARRTTKTILWILCVIVLLLAVAVGCACLVLTPKRLTPLTERIVNNMIDGRVDIGRIDFSLISTFPRFILQVDSITVISSIDGVPDGADTVATLSSLHGTVNLGRLLQSGIIELGNVELGRLTANAVIVNDSLANFNIMPTDSTDTVADTGPAVIPAFSINRFTLSDGALLRYRSMADSVDIAMTINACQLTSDGIPTYNVGLHGLTSGALGSFSLPDSLSIGADGTVTYNPDRPTAISLNDFRIAVDSLSANISTEIDFTDDIEIKSLEFSTGALPLQRIVQLVPDGYATRLPVIGTDLTASMNAHMLKPYVITDDSITRLPSIDADILLSDGYLTLDRQTIPQIGMAARIHLDGDSLNASTVNISRFFVRGPATTVNLSAYITEPLSDMLIDGTFSGSINFNSMPKALKQLIPYRLNGLLSGDTDFRMRRSQLTAETFHRALVTGQLRLHRFSADNDTVHAYLNDARLHFGTATRFVNSNSHNSSMLSASMKIDSIAMLIPADGMSVMLTDVRIGAGADNKTSITDTTAITPIGCGFVIGSLRYRSEADSMRVFMRDCNAQAVIKRFHGQKLVPEVSIRAGVKRMAVIDAVNRLILRDAGFNVLAHLNPPDRRWAAIRAHRRDSVAAANPHLNQQQIDSILIAGFRRNQVKADESTIDLTLNRTTAGLFRRLDLKGRLDCGSARIFTPFFPQRIDIDSVDLGFSTDSIYFDRARLSTAGSDFTFSGEVSNIRNALTSRRGDRALRMKLSMRSDTIDINQLTRTFMQGAAIAQSADSLKTINGSIADNASDRELQERIESIDTTAISAILIPTNIDASFMMRADNVKYADMILNGMRGALMIRDGSVNLRRFTARTDVGTASLSALYSARNKESISASAAMQLKRFHIDRFVRMMPTVDSIMPLLNDIGGVIDADIAATTRLDSLMDIDMPSLKVMMALSGDSLVVLDQDTYKTMAKWLMFKDKKHNMINHMSVQMSVDDSKMQLYPFMFDFDRYRIGVMGSNDLDLNLNYHVSVLKSPLPFKFGINITGTADNIRIRPGKARFKENMAAETVALSDSTRINLVNEIESAFRRGVSASMRISKKPDEINAADIKSDTISATDSIEFIKAGLIAAPEMPPAVVAEPQKKERKKSKK